MTDARQFDVTILGATGWTARICAEHIARTQPTGLRWCIAGRSRAKLEELSRSLHAIDPDREPPAVCVVPELTATSSLAPLVRDSKVVVNGVGPYNRHATPVVEACARAGTHYVDFATETPWVADVVRSYDGMARASGAVLVPSASLSSAPSDLVAWLVASRMRGAGLGTPTEVVAVGKLTLLGLQGGSAETVLSVAERYGIGWLRSPDPWVMSSQRKPRGADFPSSSSAQGWLGRRFGYRRDERLGLLGTSFVAASNQAVVQRSAGLQPEVYGCEFVYREYIPASGRLAAILLYLLTNAGILLLELPWFRALVRSMMYEPGSGPDRDESRKMERAEFKAVGYAKGQEEPVAAAQFIYDGALVDISAILAVEAAATLLGFWGQTGRRGGFLTPSTLGMGFVEGLKRAGAVIEVHQLNQTPGSVL